MNENGVTFPRARGTRILVVVFIGACVLLLAGIATHWSKRTPPDPTPRVTKASSRESNTQPISVVTLGSLQSELHPCGCTKPPTGGIDRWLTLFADYQKRDGSPLVLDCGDSLISRDYRLLHQQPQLPRAKSKFVRRFQRLLTDSIICVGELELLQGLPWLESTRMKDDAQYVLTNVSTSSAAFSLQWNGVRKGVRIRVLNVVDPKTIPSDLGDGIILTSPLESVSAAIASSEDYDMLVVSIHTNDEIMFRNIAALAQGPTVLIDAGHAQLGLPYAISGHVLMTTIPSRGINFQILELQLSKDRQANWIDAARAESVDAFALSLQARSSSPGDAQFQSAETLASQAVRQAQRQRLAAHHAQFTRIKLVSSVVSDDRGLSIIRECDTALSRLIPERPSKESLVLYQGAESCGKCHKAEYDNWLTSAHSKAWKTLEAAGPGSTENAECISCHVTGFSWEGGPKSKVELAPLHSVQCEACHVPLVTNKKQDDHKFSKLSSLVCLECHTGARSPGFEFQHRLPRASCQVKHEAEPTERHK